MSVMVNGERRNRADWQSQLNFFHARLKNQREETYLKQKVKTMEKDLGSKVSFIQQESRIIKLDNIGLTKTSGNSSEGWFEDDSDVEEIVKETVENRESRSVKKAWSSSKQSRIDSHVRKRVRAPEFDGNNSKISGNGSARQSSLPRSGTQRHVAKYSNAMLNRSRNNEPTTTSTMNVRPISVELGQLHKHDARLLGTPNESLKIAKGLGHSTQDTQGSRPWSAGDVLGTTTERPQTSKQLRKLMKTIRQRHDRDDNYSRTGVNLYGVPSGQNILKNDDTVRRDNDRAIKNTVRTKWLKSALKATVSNAKEVHKKVTISDVTDDVQDIEEGGQMGSPDEDGQKGAKPSGFGLLTLLLQAQTEQSNHVTRASKVPDVRRRRLSVAEEALKAKRNRVLQSSVATLIGGKPFGDMVSSNHHTSKPQTRPEISESSTTTGGTKKFQSVARDTVAKENQLLESPNTLAARFNLASVFSTNIHKKLNLKKNVEVHEDDSDNERPVSARSSEGKVQEGLISGKPSSSKVLNYPKLEDDLIQLKRTLATLQTTREKELRSMQEGNVVDHKKELDKERRERLMAKVRGFNSVLDTAVRERKRHDGTDVLVDLMV